GQASGRKMPASAFHFLAGVRQFSEMGVGLGGGADQQHSFGGSPSAARLHQEVDRAGILYVDVFNPVVVASLGGNQSFKVDAVNLAVRDDDDVSSLGGKVSGRLHKGVKELFGCRAFVQSRVSLILILVRIDQNIHSGSGDA